MKQVVIQGGKVVVVDVAAPTVRSRTVLVRVAHSCISAGTERVGVAAASESILTRALRRPARVRQAIDMARARGWRATIAHAQGALTVTSLGYSAAGFVLETGEEVNGFARGDRVACAGAGFANHAELIEVPVNLVVRIPESVGTDAASTVALGAIAMQGIRRAAPTIGESVLVVGLGLLGQLVVQLLKACGCTTIGADPDRVRVEVAKKAGLEEVVTPDAQGYGRDIAWLTGGRGVDAVIITAATEGHELVNFAMKACRRKGRVVVVGDIGLHLDRAEFYAKELDLLISTSYGPGRYDADYESEGIDYPFPYVRWTENRNMGAYLNLLASGAVKLAPLPTEVFKVDHAPDAYARLLAQNARPLVVLLEYETMEKALPKRVDVTPRQATHTGTVRVAIVGLGSFAQGMHLPNLVQLRELFEVRAVMGRAASTRLVAERFGARYATTSFDELLADTEIDLILIATRHDSHTQLALAGLKAGKHVFVEKPLAVTESELRAVELFFGSHTNVPILMTGFNRRFSPALRAAKDLLRGRKSPLMASYRVNAGYLPPEHWVHGPQGGGRNLGEACHMYDVFSFLTGAPSVAVSAMGIDPPNRHLRRDDNFVATVRYQDGSVCTLTYSALGAGEHSKERMDVFAEGRVLSLNDYCSLDVFGAKEGGWHAQKPDKGHLSELRALYAGIRDGQWPISLAEQLDVVRVGLNVERSLYARGNASSGGTAHGESAA